MINICFFILIFIFFFSKIRKKNNSKDKLVMLRIQMYIRKTNLFGRYWKYSLGSNISLSYLLSLSLFTSLFMSPFLDVLSWCLSFSFSLFHFLFLFSELFRWPSHTWGWITLYNNRDYIFAHSVIYHFFLSYQQTILTASSDRAFWSCSCGFDGGRNLDN